MAALLEVSIAATASARMKEEQERRWMFSSLLSTGSSESFHLPTRVPAVDLIGGSQPSDQQNPTKQTALFHKEDNAFNMCIKGVLKVHDFKVFSLRDCTLLPLSLYL